MIGPGWRTPAIEACATATIERGDGLAGLVRDLMEHRGTAQSGSEPVDRSESVPAEVLAAVLRSTLDIDGEPDAQNLDRARQAVCRFTTVLKAQGTPPEKVVVALKDALRGACFAEDEDGRRRLRRLTREAITWCVTTYYRMD